MSARQATSGVQRATPSSELVKIDGTTSVPADLFEELMRAAEKTRAGGQHMLVQNSKGTQRLVHACILERPKKSASRNEKVFSNVTKMSNKESLSNLEKVASRVASRDVLSTVKGHQPSVVVAAASDVWPSSWPLTTACIAADKPRDAFDKSWRMC